MAGKRLLAVHAHPDDESSKGAATMARYVAEGHDVLVATATGGEEGSILNPAMDRPEIIENMSAVRREEMARAAAKLGVSHLWMGYRDSGLPEGDPQPPLPEGSFATLDPDIPTQKLVRIIRTFRPHVIITYDENGGYPHPDHLQVHAISMAAWDAAADPDYHPELGEPWEVCKLYYTHGFIPERFRILDQATFELTGEHPFAEWMQRYEKNPERARLMHRVTTRVRCEQFFQARDEALLAHRTQIDPDGIFFSVPLDIQVREWPTEEFELARTRLPQPLLAEGEYEDDLFAGIDGEWCI